MHNTSCKPGTAASQCLCCKMLDTYEPQTTAEAFGCSRMLYACPGAEEEATSKQRDIVEGLRPRRSKQARTASMSAASGEEPEDEDGLAKGEDAVVDSLLLLQVGVLSTGTDPGCHRRLLYACSL